MIREQLISWMDKYIIMDDVTLTDETERWGTLALEGPKAGAVVREITGMDSSARGERVSVNSAVGAISCRVVKRLPGGVAGVELVVAEDQLAWLRQILLDATRKLCGGPMGYAALSGQRLAQGVPWSGYHFGENQIPHEAAFENSPIIYTQGCYTSQEIVERVPSRRHVNRRRVGLLFSGGAIPKAGAVLTAA